jgi:hypothetical protein
LSQTKEASSGDDEWVNDLFDVRRRLMTQCKVGVYGWGGSLRLANSTILGIVINPGRKRSVCVSSSVVCGCDLFFVIHTHTAQAVCTLHIYLSHILIPSTLSFACANALSHHQRPESFLLFFLAVSNVNGNCELRALMRHPWSLLSCRAVCCHQCACRLLH